MFLERIKYIIWDWNGTLIDDVRLCVEVMNRLLSEHGLPQIGLKTYRRVFRFPVKEYYKTLGFDLEKISFEQIGQRFIQLYEQEFKSKVTLQPGAKELLEALNRARKHQVLISARKHERLLQDVRHFGLEQYFSEIIGLDDDLARGKAHLVKDYFERNSLSGQEVLFIGDTEHDCQIAQSLGAHYFLVANGHHSAERLMLCTTFVYANLQTLSDFLFNA